MNDDLNTDSIDPRDVIEAFADGEAVDSAALTRALESPDGREYFVDLLVLRRLVRGPGPSIVQAARPAARAGGAPRRWWAIAASVAILAATGGYLGGVRTTRDAGSDSAPTPAAAIARTEAGAMPAPPPTSVIRLERGVDWAERFGGL